MSTHFSANQYENAFAAKRLQNWETPASYKERPSRLEGFTKPIANNKGHLLSGVTKSPKSPWGEFVGTWDSKADNKKLPISKLKHDGNAEILMVHSSPRPTSKAKDEKITSPIPEPFDEENIGIAKHLNSVKIAENLQECDNKATVVSPKPDIGISKHIDAVKETEKIIH